MRALIDAGARVCLMDGPPLTFMQVPVVGRQWSNDPGVSVAFVIASIPAVSAWKRGRREVGLSQSPPARSWKVSIVATRSPASTVALPLFGEHLDRLALTQHRYSQDLRDRRCPRQLPLSRDSWDFHCLCRVWKEGFCERLILRVSWKLSLLTERRSQGVGR